MDPSHEYVRLSCTSLCACGGTHGDNEECLAGKPANADDALAGAMAQGMLHGLFPEHGLRRAFVKTLGRAGALAALTALTPLTQLAAVAQERKGAPEKIRLAVGFLPITCATPLIYAEQLGLFPREGLELSLQKIAGIALIRDKMVNGELDISQQVMPVALAMSAGIGGAPIPARVMTVLNQNGNSLVLSMKHKDNRRPEELERLQVRRAVRAVPSDAAPARSRSRLGE